MTGDIMHAMEFVEREEYIRGQNEDGYYADHVFALTGSTKLVVPDTGDVVTFGWFEDEESGEKVERVDFEWTGVDYIKSQRYEVLDVDHHYHHRQTESDHSDGLAVNKIEITTKVIVTEYEE